METSKSLINTCMSQELDSAHRTKSCFSQAVYFQAFFLTLYNSNNERELRLMNICVSINNCAAKAAYFQAFQANLAIFAVTAAQSTFTFVTALTQTSQAVTTGISAALATICFAFTSIIGLKTWAIGRLWCIFILSAIDWICSFSRASIAVGLALRIIARSDNILVWVCTWTCWNVVWTVGWNLGWSVDLDLWIIVQSAIVWGRVCSRTHSSIAWTVYLALWIIAQSDILLAWVSSWTHSGIIVSIVVCDSWVGTASILSRIVIYR